MNFKFCYLLFTQFLATLILLSQGSEVYPITYSYNTWNITRPNEENCPWLKHSSGNFIFRRCTHPSVLTDSSNDTSIRGRYIAANTRDGRFLFKFSSYVILTHITLTYDYDSGERYGLPDVTFYAVADDYEIWNETRGTVIANVPHGQEQEELRNITIEITANVSTRKLLMYIHYMRDGHILSLREIDFFGDELELPPVRVPTSTLSTISASTTVGTTTTTTATTAPAPAPAPAPPPPITTTTTTTTTTTAPAPPPPPPPPITTTTVINNSTLILPMFTTLNTGTNIIEEQTKTSAKVTTSFKSSSPVTMVHETPESLVTSSVNSILMSTVSVTASLTTTISEYATTTVNGVSTTNENGNIPPSSITLGATMGVVVFIVLFCGIGIPVISVFVILHSKRQQRRKNKVTSPSHAHPLHSSSYDYEKIELNGLNGHESGSTNNGVSNKSSKAMLTSAESNLDGREVRDSGPAIHNTAITPTQPDEANTEPAYQKLQSANVNKKHTYANVWVTEIDPYPCTTLWNENNMDQTPHATRSLLQSDRPLPTVPSCTTAEEDTQTSPTAPKKRKKRKKKKSLQVPEIIETDENAPPVPPQTVDCLYAAVIKKTKGTD